MIDLDLTKPILDLGTMSEDAPAGSFLAIRESDGAVVLLGGREGRVVGIAYSELRTGDAVVVHGRTGRVTRKGELA